MANGVMGDFEKAQYVLPALHEYMDVHLKPSMEMLPDRSEQEVRAQLVQTYEELKEAEVYTNDQYQVLVDRKPEHGFPDMEIWHLSIKRLDKEVIRDWRDLQEIKNRLAGTDVEAIEMFPAAGRVVDTANQYHLFAFIWQRHSKKSRQRPRLPLGWGRGLIADHREGLKSKQRPLPAKVG